MAWWQWTFDGVGGAVAVGVAGWVIHKVAHRGRSDPVTVTQTATGGGVNVHLTGRFRGTINIISERPVPAAVEEAVLAPVTVDAHGEATSHPHGSAEARKRDYIEAVRKLPEVEAIAFTLYYYEHMTFAEIGSVIAADPERVKRLVSEAVNRLRFLLFGQLPEPGPAQ